jgi:aryl-alcohol dehydrogenase
MKIQAAIIKKTGGSFCIEDVSLQEPRPDEILVRIVASGICHADEITREQDAPFPLPVVLGHEGSGIVERVGGNVTDLKPGDSVCLTFAFCGECENCKSAKPYICEHFNDINFGGVYADGTTRLSQNGQSISAFFGQSSFATHAVVNRRSAIKVDADVPLEIVGPLGCGIQTGAGTVLNRLRPEFGASIVIFGIGSVGMSALMAAKVSGCARIIAIGGHAAKLELAKELGATHTINRHEISDVVGEIKQITGGGAHYAVDASGAADILHTALACVRIGGTVAVLGATEAVTLHIQQELMGDGKNLISVLEGDSNPQVFIPKLIDYYKAGNFPFDKMITFYNFNEIDRAFADTHAGRTIKAVIRM